MGTPRFVIFGLALTAGCSPLAPVGPDSAEPLVPTAATVAAVTVPDTLRDRVTFDVVVHRVAACATDRPTTFEWSGDSLLVSPTVMPVADCAPNAGWPVYVYPECSSTTVRTSPLLRTGPFDVVVTSANARRIGASVRMGVAALGRGFVQRFEVRRPDGAPVEGAEIVVSTLATPPVALATLVTGADGRAELAMPASTNEITVQEHVRTSGSGSEQWYPSVTLRRNAPVKTIVIDRP